MDCCHRQPTIRCGDLRRGAGNASRWQRHGQGNIISGNTSYGVVIDGNNVITTSGNYIQGNYIGLNAAGDADIANGAGGIRIHSGAQSNFIGGDWNAGEGNVISGNSGGPAAAIYISGDTTDEMRFKGIESAPAPMERQRSETATAFGITDADGTIIGGDSTAGLGQPDFR